MKTTIDNRVLSPDGSKRLIKHALNSQSDLNLMLKSGKSTIFSHVGSDGIHEQMSEADETNRFNNRTDNSRSP
jgi:hypothetical protein